MKKLPGLFDKENFTKGFFITWAVLFLVPTVFFELLSLGMQFGFAPAEAIYEFWWTVEPGPYTRVVMLIMALLYGTFTGRLFTSFVITLILKRIYDKNESLRMLASRMLFKKKE